MFDAGECANGHCVSADCYSCKYLDGTSWVYSERRWDTYEQNFDNTVNAFIVLFEMSTLEAWPSIALNGVDAVGVDQWPNKQADASPENPFAFVYFVVFIIVGTFFVANLFASVACDKYENMSQFYSGMLFLTDHQKVWVVDSKQVWATKPKKFSPEPIVPELKNIVTKEWFDNLIMSFIIINIITMSVEYEGMDDTMSDALEYLNLIFVAVFTVELIMKVLGLGVEAYLSDRFNIFDMVVVVASLVSLAAPFGPIASIFRIFRVARVLKLIPRAENLMAIVMTVYHSLPALFNVGCLTALFFVIFACLGVSLFGQVVYGAQLSRWANFETFGTAMLTLFRVATGEDWNGMMYDLALEDGQINAAGNSCTSVYPCPDSYGSEPCGCGINVVSQLYFLVFNVLSAFVMLNVVVAAILTHFDLAQQSAEGLSDRMIDIFKNEWWKLDPTATARIQVKEFPIFFNKIYEAFDFEELRTRNEQNISKEELCSTMMKKCEDSGGEFRFSEVLYVVAFEKFGHSLGWTMKARELEEKVARAKIKLDNEPGSLEKPVVPQLTENQLMEMSMDELREQLVMRGHVRFRNNVDVEVRRESYGGPRQSLGAIRTVPHLTPQVE